jgi:hypothetical protein
MSFLLTSLTFIKKIIKKRTVKILIRLHRCEGWSGSALLTYALKQCIHGVSCHLLLTPNDQDFAVLQGVIVMNIHNMFHANPIKNVVLRRIKLVFLLFDIVS